MDNTRLACLSPASAAAVAEAAKGHEPYQCAYAADAVVVLTYTDKRYPLDVAEWAFDNGHASDDAASAMIAAL